MLILMLCTHHGSVTAQPCTLLIKGFQHTWYIRDEGLKLALPWPLPPCSACPSQCTHAVVQAARDMHPRNQPLLRSVHCWLPPVCVLCLDTTQVCDHIGGPDHAASTQPRTPSACGAGLGPSRPFHQHAPAQQLCSKPRPCHHQRGQAGQCYSGVGQWRGRLPPGPKQLRQRVLRGILVLHDTQREMFWGL